MSSSLHVSVSPSPATSSSYSLEQASVKTAGNGLVASDVQLATDVSRQVNGSGSTTTTPSANSPTKPKINLYTTIVVNDFMFCAEHGDEYCYTCCCDHRLTNNIIIEEELLGEGGEEDFDFDLESRQSINIHSVGATPALHTESSFQCEKHAVIDCKECFDWVEVLKRGEEAIEEFVSGGFGERDGSSEELNEVILARGGSNRTSKRWSLDRDGGVRWNLGSARKEGEVLSEALDKLLLNAGKDTSET